MLSPFGTSICSQLRIHRVPSYFYATVGQRLLGITRKDKEMNRSERRQGLQKLELIIKERRLRWLGHVLNGVLHNTSSGYKW